MKAFVTGSTGLLGSNLVNELRASGAEVIALARSPEKARRQLPEGVRVVQGDLEDIAAFAPHLEGCDVVFHTAAYFREYYTPGDHWPTLKRLNVDATLTLLHEAQRRRVRRVVVTSSSGTIGPNADGAAGDETTPPGADQLRNLYFKSKVEMDRQVAQFAAANPLEVVTVVPGWMLGPNDAGPTGSGDLVLRFLARQFPGIVDGGASTVDARDVASAMLAAARRGRPGERYAVAGRFVHFRELFAALERASGVAAPTRVVPPRLLEAVAWLGERASRLTGRPAPITFDGVRTMHLKRAVDSSKAQRELGVTFRPLDDTVRDTVAWFRANGYDRSWTPPSTNEARSA